MSLSRTISPDTACEALTTVSTSSCSTGAPMVAVARCGDWCLAEMRMKLFELPHLAERAPAKIAAPRIPQIGVGDRLEAARRVEPRGHLMGQTLVLHETMLAGRSNGLLVQTHRIGVSPFEAGDLGRHQRVLVGESRRIVVGPLAQLFPVRRQEFAPHCSARQQKRSHRAPPPSARCSKNSRAAGYERPRPKAAPSPCRLPRAPRRSRLTGTAPSV